MKKIVRFLFALCIVFLGFSCNKKETTNPNSPVNFLPVYYGSGNWNIDQYIYYPSNSSSQADTMTNYGSIQFANDTLAIFTSTGVAGSQVLYRLNEDKSMFILNFGAGDYLNAPVSWFNANKMRLSFVDVQDTGSFQRIFILSREQ